MQDVAGKVAFITGGASGIGLGMAKVFVDAGMKVVLADLRQDHLDSALAGFEAAGQRGSVHGIRLDVTDRAAMAAAADEAEAVFGKTTSWPAMPGWASRVRCAMPRSMTGISVWA